MNKECRNDLDRIKGQSYKLFLQNLLDKEERAHRKIRRINFKYLTYKEERTNMEKREAEEIISIVKMAKKIGEAAGRGKLRELCGNGHKWKVVDKMNDDKVVGHMLDVCGFAHITVPGRGKVARAFKKVGEYDRRMDGYVVRGMRIWKGWPSGFSLSIINTGRQEMSVNEAAVQAASEYLNANHLDCVWNSRID